MKPLSRAHTHTHAHANTHTRTRTREHAHAHAHKHKHKHLFAKGVPATLTVNRMPGVVLPLLSTQSRAWSCSPLSYGKTSCNDMYSCELAPR